MSEIVPLLHRLLNDGLSDSVSSAALATVLLASFPDLESE